MERKKRILKDYKRESHFDYFNSLSYPYVGVTVNVEITDLLKKVKAEKLPFFSHVLLLRVKGGKRCP